MSAGRRYKPATVRAAFSRWFVGEESEDGEQRAFCPICEDPDESKSPSASFNAARGVFKCQGKCGTGGTIIKLAEDLKKERGFDIRSARMEGLHQQDPEFAATAQENLSKSSRRSGKPLPDENGIDRFCIQLKGVFLDRLVKARGWSPKTIKELRIGWHGAYRRYTIPIYDANGKLVNVRMYRLNAKQAKDKMINWKNYGSAHIYGFDDLKEFNDIIITEGEPDRILLRQHLAGRNFGVVTHTAGAKAFKTEWGRLFQDKRVWTCYDNDETGRRGAIKVRNVIAPFAESVGNIQIPLNYAGADVTDYLHKEGHSIEDFLALLEEAPRSGDVKSVETSGRSVSLLESTAQELQRETLELVVSVSGKQAEPFTAPKEIIAICDMSKGIVCESCPLSAYSGDMKVSIRRDDEQIFRFVDVSEQRRKALIKEITGARCNDRVEYEIPENWHIEELLVQPSVDNRKDDETQKPTRRTVFSVSTHKTGVNEKLRLVGRNLEDAKSGTLRFVAWHNEPVEFDIDRFQLTPEIRRRLTIFQPSNGQPPLDKCLEIARDLADNVTHIFQRDLLHVCCDLVWHSVLSFRIGGTVEKKGWLEALVIGDTRTGKSDVVKKLLSHYNSGQLLSCEGMSFAGIVGGVQQLDGRWHLTWGAVPMNDRRLVILDEMSGLKDKDVIEQMSSIRSSGIAQITKITSEQTSARTRLIWIANPADGSMLANSPDVGMAAMMGLVPNAEDVARFDFVTATAQGEVPVSVMNSGYKPLYSPQYSSQDCELLVKWAWSLTRSDVLVSEAAVAEAGRAAEKVANRYVPEPPLLQPENARLKILRIACAIAARTFSITKTGKLSVTPIHVRDAVRFLDLIYEQESMGYARKSRRVLQGRERATQHHERCKAWLREYENVWGALRSIGEKTFRARDFEEFGAMSRDESHTVVQRLQDWQMVERGKRGEIRMTPTLAKILRELEDEE